MQFFSSRFSTVRGPFGRAKFTTFSFVALLTGGLLIASPIAMASQCKGKEQAQCVDDSACTWVDPYTRKDGREVGGYCRVKAGKKSAAQDTKAGDKASN